VLRDPIYPVRANRRGKERRPLLLVKRPSINHPRRNDREGNCLLLGIEELIGAVIHVGTGRTWITFVCLVFPPPPLLQSIALRCYPSVGRVYRVECLLEIGGQSSIIIERERVNLCTHLERTDWRFDATRLTGLYTIDWRMIDRMRGPANSPSQSHVPCPHYSYDFYLGGATRGKRGSCQFVTLRIQHADGLPPVNRCYKQCLMHRRNRMTRPSTTDWD